MPEKSFTVATYAAGASLAAITLIYVFAPTYFLDNDQPSLSNPLSALAGRKKGVVGLANAANDCFINSILQALAGLVDLRLYLIRETHRRNIDDAWVYSQAVPDATLTNVEDNTVHTSPPRSPRRPLPAWKVEGLQRGLVTKGLKEILDQLNERPIYKKTITAVPFVKVLEAAFRQRISRQQQDAQEFLQVVAERLCDEYHAGQRARTFAKRKARRPSPHGPPDPSDRHCVDPQQAEDVGPQGKQPGPTQRPPSACTPAVLPGNHLDDEHGFPMEGKIKSQIECLTCGFKPRPSEQTFCTLTLNVPQVSSTTLNLCFDGMFKTEFIEEFKCEKCRLVHATQFFEAEAAKATSEGFQKDASETIKQLQAAIDADPEKPPEGVVLPDSRFAPKRKIARHTRVTSFPKVLAIHLSRSIYDSSQMSQKNSAKVSFPERLPLGGLLQQKKYKLLGLVTHKGSHHSGHYESFRRQNTYPPYSNPSTFQASGLYSPSASPSATPRIGATLQASRDNSPLASSPDLLTPESLPDNSSTTLDSNTSSGPSTRSSPMLGDRPSSSPRLGPTSAPRRVTRAGKESDPETSSLRSITRSTLSRMAPSSAGASHSRSRAATPVRGTMSTLGEGDAVGRHATSMGSRPKKKRQHDRWWRISDEKVKESSTKEVLGMQREVYLLFYELERSP